MTLPVAEGLGLPASVVNRVRMAPAEDIILAIFRQGLPDLDMGSEIPMEPADFYLLLRRLPEAGLYEGRRGVNKGLLDHFDFAAHVYAGDPDGDQKAALIADAVVDVAHEAWMDHWRFVGLGSVNKLECTQGPTRVTDWATSTGPVQYADLPTGDWRYEIRFRARINPPPRG